MNRTTKMLTPHDSSGTGGLGNLGGIRGRAFCRTLIVFLATMQLSFAAIGTAQESMQRRVGQDRVKSSVPGQFMPDLRGDTFEDAKKRLIEEYRQERITPEYGSSDLPVGQIYKQVPSANTRLGNATQITLYVSTGPSVQPTDPNPDIKADISVTQTLDKKKLYGVGEVLQYTIVVRNAGPDTATNVQISVSATNLINPVFDITSGECIDWTCTIKSIDARTSANITMTATIAAEGNFRNYVQVTAAEFDPETGNNKSEEIVGEADSSADISVDERLDTVGPFRAGQSVQYTLIISNAGPSSASNIRIVEMRTNLTITEVSEPCKNFPCTIPNLAVGADATIKLIASIDREGSFEFAANVQATEHDVNPSNNNIHKGDITSSDPSPRPTPTQFPPSWLWPILILIGGGGALAVTGSGTYLVWHWIATAPTPAPPVPPSPPPVPPLPPAEAPVPPPTPVVKSSVDLELGRSVIDGLQLTGPEIRLRTDLEMGESTFDGPVPIVRREVING